MIDTTLIQLREKDEEIARLREALRRIGGLCQWVGWLESPCNHIRHAAAAKDMRKIQEIAAETLGVEFMEYT